eukprot:CAMPEP_0201534234 /NCGR_PEP_ID=MMETSP0161_2-20130828/55698_1 /ASSEMBLY_ACC=CAM_ASM_000251 /TAXON_ID=180227 /ORGANISM="Neoparamoeba aestuarina, Strain SoJaBio B1-5/56/2" /LENGTH=378 /DNA_ID=CAMNT_0047938765 /DNA_START=49 /DNA_END=1185 /DNA_ORIENTATION=+
MTCSTQKAMELAIAGKLKEAVILSEEGLKERPDSQQAIAVHTVLTNRLEAQNQLVEELKTKDFPLQNFGSTFPLQSDNGYVGYAVYGYGATKDGKFDGKWEEKKQNTTICLFFHGLPGSRLFFSKAMAQAAEERKVTVLVLERPGYGISSLVAKEITWDMIVKEVLESFGLLEGKKVIVIGYSGGGPYALSLGVTVLSQHISSISVVGCACPPIEGATRGFSSKEKLGFFFAQHSSWFLEKAIRYFDWEDFHEDPIGYFYNSYTLFSTSDTSSYLYDPDIERAFVLSAKELLCDRHKGVKAEARDYEMACKEWPFNPALIKNPVLIWFGEEDVAPVVEVGCPYLEKTIPNTTTFKVPQRGHLLIFTDWERILDEGLKY